jgi:hypothetical protein
MYAKKPTVETMINNPKEYMVDDMKEDLKSTTVTSCDSTESTDLELSPRANDTSPRTVEDGMDDVYGQASPLPKFR